MILLSSTLRIFPFTRKESNPITGLDMPQGFLEVEDPRFHDNRHRMEVRL